MAMGVHADRYVPEKQRRVEALISFTRPLSNGAKGMRPDERNGFVVVLRVGRQVHSQLRFNNARANRFLRCTMKLVCVNRAANE
jgi:hypothetical protein